MFKNHLRQHANLISLICLLIGFVVFVVLANRYYNINILQRDDFSATKTAHYAQLIERIGPYDKQLRTDINSHLTMLRDGGALISPEGPGWYMPAAVDDQILNAMTRVDNAVKTEDYDAFQNSYLEFSNISAQANKRALEKILRLQWLAGTIILLGFLGILARLFFVLRRADERALQTAAENRHIMATVKDGLFVIGENFEIGPQKSNAVTEIFGEDIAASGNFFSFIEHFISEEDLQLVREFVELLFDNQTTQKLMPNANPSQEFAIHIETEDGSVTTKYINVAFSQNEGDFERNGLLVCIKDITKEILLKQELDSMHELQSDRTNLLKNVLQADMSELHNFFTQSENGFNEIGTLLAAESGDHIDNLNKLNTIYDISHKLKSDAHSFGLAFFETSILRFEESVLQIRGLTNIDSTSMLALATRYKDLVSDIDLVDSLIPQKREPFTSQNSFGSEDYDTDSASVSERINILAQRVADREGKEIEIDCSGFHLLEDDPELQDTLFDITIQLIRNSVVHGIEPAEERVQLGKKTYGTISILLSRREDEKLQLIVRDDGRGLQFSSIKQTAIEKGLLNEAASSVIETKRLLKFIFVPGFSSADHPSVDAGRGIGLDVVKSKINTLSGKIGVRTSRNKYCQFKIVIPYSRD